MVRALALGDDQGVLRVRHEISLRPELPTLAELDFLDILVAREASDASRTNAQLGG
jgi:hypothetical protein